MGGGALLTLSSPNEPTLGPGGLPVYDVDGLFVGLTTNRIDVPSEDLARVVIRLSDPAKERFGLLGSHIDVEATWLERTSRGPDEPCLTLVKPLGEALVEEGFLVELPGPADR